MGPFTDSEDAIDYARRQWEEGEQRVTRYTPDSERRAVLEDIIEQISAELEKRIGQTFTMAELAEEYSAADAWCREVAHSTAPDHPWAWEVGPVQDAAFYRFARRAQDYQP